MTSAFEKETAVEAAGGGCYRAQFTDQWIAPVVPQGGLVTATAVRAMACEVDDPALRLRSLTTVFTAQVTPGAIEIDVEILRRGRSVTQCRATLRNAGADAGHTTVAVFGASKPGFEFTDVAPPVVDPPEACVSFRDPPPPEWEPRRGEPPFWEHIEGRPLNGSPPWEEWVATSSERMNWYRFDEVPWAEDGRLDPGALITLADLMPPAVGHRMGSGTPMWMPPSCDLTVHLLGDARSDWILGRNTCRHAADGYASAAMELWDQHGTLCAYATQIMLLVFPEGPPVGEQRVPRDQRG